MSSHPQNVEKSEFRFSQFVDEDVFYQLLRYARFLMLPATGQDELGKAGCKVQQLQGKSLHMMGTFGCDSALDRTNEENALNLIATFARTKLASYPTSLDEDQRALGRELKPWKISALRLLRDEKRPLAYLQEIVERLQALQEKKKGGLPVPTGQSGIDCENQLKPIDGEVYWKCQMDKVVFKY